MMAKEMEQQNKEVEVMELDFDELEQVTGGSIRDVGYTPTVDISDDVISRI